MGTKVTKVTEKTCQTLWPSSGAGWAQPSAQWLFRMTWLSKIFQSSGFSVLYQDLLTVIFSMIALKVFVSGKDTASSPPWVHYLGLTQFLPTTITISGASEATTKLTMGPPSTPNRAGNCSSGSHFPGNHQSGCLPTWAYKPRASQSEQSNIMKRE